MNNEELNEAKTELDILHERVEHLQSDIDEHEKRETAREGVFKSILHKARNEAISRRELVEWLHKELVEMGIGKRVLTTRERAVSGKCPYCHVENGAPCNQTIGQFFFISGIKVHMSRYQAAPYYIQDQL